VLRLPTEGKAIMMCNLAMMYMAAKVTIERWTRDAGAWAAAAVWADGRQFVELGAQITNPGQARMRSASPLIAAQ
jgi:hypothetical protein